MAVLGNKSIAYGKFLSIIIKNYFYNIRINNYIVQEETLENTELLNLIID